MPTVFVLPFPAIDPVIFEIGPFALRWYALAYIVGIILAWRYMRALVRNDRLWAGLQRPTPVDLDDFVLWGTFGIIIGGRLGYVLFYNPSYYFANPGEALAVWTGGMSFHGGFAGTVIAIFLFAWRRGLSVWTLFDLAGCAAPIGLFFGRIANFINAELWGRTTDVPWAVVFPGAGPEPRHPSQIYEAALEGVVLFLVLRLLSHRFKLLEKPGFLAGAFAFGYGVGRSIAELYRVPDAHIGYLSGFLTMGILLSLPMILGGIALMVWAARRSNREARN
ncbi:MAG: prolipoprotein diacylglyceryl transferase [Roseibium album]|uniref:Phosphatidylglycerol--prolipoprotein diacylglyceryl transferase n=1 Tax=Roseibium album TaxID=311410 RepID=A0A0M7AS36_9HYPH|nr:prolipoprotein diacylglyceryl transferase [Roseibium album]MBG6146538.1 phosphatidylglycerol:prolipoprotein diacylglycerol transferase [Labrenzia sp. EL_142]MBG6173513.1 phosphatidylglycerol:prolipoprotein diacylglycerol transferase [Labrenzia sp. EL_132]MBG6202222.1 phosphatidylglycerol:prolipoprotein diacylglycerol transferase [Labrenzia sp. EL_13]MBG6227717.1 phosphatidylglycerol:prolipoprotein diacylglycerol transferase [Labrenzia sp. EL_208]MCR9058164.1 prolipoprotein diacylglyceryl tr